MAVAEGIQKTVVISVLGSDRPGIVYEVSKILAKSNANIQDISQTILQGVFTMTMLCELEDIERDFLRIQDELQDVASRLGVQVVMQREEVFKYMYRL